ncbi:MAG: protease [Clostridia bacterium]|jgi:protease-4|nr:sppA [Clostridiales bacterium]MDK2985547.1 protease [Clostridia bacterium]
MSKKVITGAFLLLLAFVVIFSFVGTNRFYDRGQRNEPGQAIALIHIEGPITGGASSKFLEARAGSMSIMEQLKSAREDNDVKAVLLRINSPGGSAAASQEIAAEIDKIKEAGKIVVASMGDIAASGGYWIAARADKIMANAATMTGSIGVIMQQTDLTKLYEKIGIDINVIKSGKYKDIGSSAREMSPEEREILQSMVNDIFEQFVQVVAEGRNLPEDEVRKIADGRIFTGKQAKELGLVDRLGNFYDAVQFTADLAAIEGEPEIKVYTAPGPFGDFFNIFSLKGILKKNFVEIY